MDLTTCQNMITVFQWIELFQVNSEAWILSIGKSLIGFCIFCTSVLLETGLKVFQI